MNKVQKSLKNVEVKKIKVKNKSNYLKIESKALTKLTLKVKKETQRPKEGRKTKYKWIQKMEHNDFCPWSSRSDDAEPMNWK